MLAAPALGSATIQGIAGEREMLFGAAVRAEHLDDDALRELLLRETGVLTPEIEMKWGHIEREAGKLDFSGADRIANFAQAHGKRLHGHTLLWHRSIPDWALAALPDKAGWRLIEAFMTATMSRYHGVETWDVVNEPVDVTRGAEGLRPSPFLAAFGPGYIARALHKARELAPRAVLCINEYGLEYDLPEQAERRKALLRLLASLRRSGAPIDAVGIQAHLDLAHQASFNERVLAEFLNDLGALGLQVRISELDVKEVDSGQPASQRDAQVAEAVDRFLHVALANRAVGTVACWGISDRYSWLGSPAENRGLPYDESLVAKPMREAIIGSFRGARPLGPPLGLSAGRSEIHGLLHVQPK